MLDKMSNTSRLIEKLRIKGLLERRECPIDRRKAEIELTSKGLALINEASIILDEALIRRIEVLNQEEVGTLNKILDKLNQ
jgi:DNA-binding MarR family transcriptional regulator